MDEDQVQVLQERQPKTKAVWENYNLITPFPIEYDEFSRNMQDPEWAGVAYKQLAENEVTGGAIEIPEEEMISNVQEEGWALSDDAQANKFLDKETYDAVEAEKVKSEELFPIPEEVGYVGIFGKGTEPIGDHERGMIQEQRDEYIAGKKMELYEKSRMQATKSTTNDLIGALPENPTATDIVDTYDSVIGYSQESRNREKLFSEGQQRPEDEAKYTEKNLQRVYVASLEVTRDLENEIGVENIGAFSETLKSLDVYNSQLQEAKDAGDEEAYNKIANDEDYIALATQAEEFIKENPKMVDYAKNAKLAQETFRAFEDIDKIDPEYRGKEQKKRAEQQAKEAWHKEMWDDSWKRKGDSDVWTRPNWYKRTFNKARSVLDVGGNKIVGQLGQMAIDLLAIRNTGTALVTNDRSRAVSWIPSAYESLRWAEETMGADALSTLPSNADRRVYEDVAMVKLDNGKEYEAVIGQDGNVQAVYGMDGFASTPKELEQVSDKYDPKEHNVSMKMNGMSLWGNALSVTTDLAVLMAGTKGATMGLRGAGKGLGAGFSQTIAPRLAMFGVMTAQIQNDYYQEAVNKGFSPKQAGVFALMASSAISAVNQFNPQFYLMGESRKAVYKSVDEAWRAYSKGVSYKESFTKGVGWMVNQGLREGGEEIAEIPAENFVRMVVNHGADPRTQLEIQNDVKDYAESFTLGALIGIAGGAVSNYSRSRLQKESLYAMYEDRTGFNQMIDERFGTEPKTGTFVGENQVEWQIGGTNPSGKAIKTHFAKVFKGADAIAGDLNLKLEDKLQLLNKLDQMYRAETLYHDAVAENDNVLADSHKKQFDALEGEIDQIRKGDVKLLRKSSQADYSEKPEMTEEQLANDEALVKEINKSKRNKLVLGGDVFEIIKETEATEDTEATYTLSTDGGQTKFRVKKTDVKGRVVSPRQPAIEKIMAGHYARQAKIAKTPEGRAKIEKSIDRASKSFESLGGTLNKLTEQEFIEKHGENARGVQLGEDGKTIDLNMDRVTDTTVFHEMLHSVAVIGKVTPEVMAKWYSDLENNTAFLKYADLAKKGKELGGTGSIEEEVVAEYMGDLSSGKVSLEITGIREALKDMYRTIMGDTGLDLENINDKDLKAFAGEFSRAFNAGELLHAPAMPVRGTEEVEGEEGVVQPELELEITNPEMVAEKQEFEREFKKKSFISKIFNKLQPIADGEIKGEVDQLKEEAKSILGNEDILQTIHAGGDRMVNTLVRNASLAETLLSSGVTPEAVQVATGYSLDANGNLNSDFGEAQGVFEGEFTIWTIQEILPEHPITEMFPETSDLSVGVKIDPTLASSYSTTKNGHINVWAPDELTATQEVLDQARGVIATTRRIAQPKEAGMNWREFPKKTTFKTDNKFQALNENNYDSENDKRLSDSEPSREDLYNNQTESGTSETSPTNEGQVAKQQVTDILTSKVKDIDMSQIDPSSVGAEIRRRSFQNNTELSVEEEIASVEAFSELVQRGGNPTVKSVMNKVAKALAREKANGWTEVTKPFTKIADGSQVTTPSKTYNDGVKTNNGDQNIWVRHSEDTSNKGRQLLVQFSSDLLYGGRQYERTAEDKYYDKLYNNRYGYRRTFDFWEIPLWIGRLSYSLPKSDVYVIRNMDEAKAFFDDAKYDKVLFSALDINAGQISDIASALPDQKIQVGGYTNFDAFKDNPNIKTYKTVEGWAKSNGVEDVGGYDYSKFSGTKIIPRLKLSNGCKYKCAFCTVPKVIEEVSDTDVKAQVKAIQDLNVRYVYMDDKTYGQAENHKTTPAIYDEIKKYNPDFEGFVVQTTAFDFNKMDDKFIQDAHLKYVELGVESYNDNILKGLHKPTSEAQVDKAVDKMRKLGINFIPNIVVGFEGETTETYQNSLDFIEKNKDIISHINVYSLAVYEGTELSDALDVRSEADRNENIVEKSFNTAEQNAINRKALADFSTLGSKLLDAVPNETGEVKSKFQPVWSEPIDDALGTIKQDKGAPAQFKSMLLKNGVKQAELDWMGWDEFAKGKKTITKEEITQWKAENTVQLEEVVKGTATEDDINTLLEDEVGENMSREDAIEFLSNEENATKFQDYQTEGGRNYTEWLLTVPPASVPFKKITAKDVKLNETKYDKYTGQRTVTIEIEGVSAGLRSGTRETNENIIKEIVKSVNESRKKEAGRSISFTGGHFSEPNIAVHTRTNERTDSEGNKVLHIEEIQSDWAQEGKKKGFKTKLQDEPEITLDRFSEDENSYVAFFSNGQQSRVGKGVVGEVAGDLKLRDYFKNILYDMNQEVKKLNNNEIPNMPFKQTPQWVGLSIKSMVQHAIEIGADQITWTTGEQQADRYDLSKQVDEIEYVQRDGQKDGIVAYKDGEVVIEQTINNENEIEGIIGKEASKNLLESPVNNEAPFKIRRIKGDQLKVGGEGMKAFYDKIVPSTINKLFKKYGVKVKTSNIAIKGELTGKKVSFEDYKDYWSRRENYGEVTQEDWEMDNKTITANGGGIGTVHSMEITPKLKEVAKQGFGKFQPDMEREVDGDINTEQSEPSYQPMLDEGINAIVSEKDEAEKIEGFKGLQDVAQIAYTAGNSLPNRDELWDQNVKEALPESGLANPHHLKDIIQNGAFAMVSGENPMTVLQADNKNHKNNNDAYEWLVKRKNGKFKPVTIFGKYGNSEVSFFVNDFGVEDAVAFAKKFKQESVATAKGLVYQNGTYHPIRRNGVMMEEGDDNYSTVKIAGENQGVQIPYDWDVLVYPEDPVYGQPAHSKIGRTDDGYIFHKTKDGNLSVNPTEESSPVIIPKKRVYPIDQDPHDTKFDGTAPDADVVIEDNGNIVSFNPNAPVYKKLPDSFKGDVMNVQSQDTEVMLAEKIIDETPSGSNESDVAKQFLNGEVEDQQFRDMIQNSEILSETIKQASVERAPVDYSRNKNSGTPTPKSESDVMNEEAIKKFQADENIVPVYITPELVSSLEEDAISYPKSYVQEELPVISLEESLEYADSDKAIIIGSSMTGTGSFTTPSGKSIQIYGGTEYLGHKQNRDSKIGYASVDEKMKNNLERMSKIMWGDGGSGNVLIMVQPPKAMLSESQSLEYTMDGVYQLLEKEAITEKDFSDEAVKMFSSVGYLNQKFKPKVLEEQGFSDEEIAVKKVELKKRHDREAKKLEGKSPADIENWIRLSLLSRAKYFNTWMLNNFNEEKMIEKAPTVKKTKQFVADRLKGLQMDTPMPNGGFRMLLLNAGKEGRGYSKLDLFENSANAREWGAWRKQPANAKGNRVNFGHLTAGFHYTQGGKPEGEAIEHPTFKGFYSGDNAFKLDKAYSVKELGFNPSVIAQGMPKAVDFSRIDEETVNRSSRKFQPLSAEDEVYIKEIADKYPTAQPLRIAELISDSHGISVEDALAVINGTRPANEDTRVKENRKTAENIKASKEMKARQPEGLKEYYVRSQHLTDADAELMLETYGLEAVIADLMTPPPDLMGDTRVFLTKKVIDELDRQAEEADNIDDTNALLDRANAILEAVAVDLTKAGQFISSARALSLKTPAQLARDLSNKIKSEASKRGEEDDITPEEHEELIRLKTAQDRAKTGLPKTKATQKTANYVAKVAHNHATRGNQVQSIIEAVWYSNILSGASTHNRNMFANFTQWVGEMTVGSIKNALKGDFIMPLKMLAGSFTGARKGLSSAVYTQLYGTRLDKNDKTEVLPILEWWRYDTGNKFIDKILDHSPWGAQTLKHVGRLLSSGDALFYHIGYGMKAEQMATYIARANRRNNPKDQDFRTANQVLYNDSESIQRAKEMATKEGYDGKGVRGYLERSIRINDIIDQQRAPEIRAEGDRFASMATFNYEPEGFLGSFYRTWVGVADKHRFMKVFVPFARIVTNVTNRYLDWTPYGVVRAMRGKSGWAQPNRKLDLDERADVAIKSMIGMTTMMMLAQASDDEDGWMEITGNLTGQTYKDYSLQGSGYRKYSFRVKGSDKWYSYIDTPLFFMMAGIGTLNDAKKYGKEDEWNDLQFHNKMVMAGSGMVGSMLETSWMMGVSDMIKGIDPDKLQMGEHEAMLKVTDKFSQTLQSIVIANGVKQAQREWMEYNDLPIKEAKTFGEAMLRDMPVANKGMNDIVSAFGVPVMPTNSEKIFFPFHGSADVDPISKLYTENGVFPAPMRGFDVYDPATRTSREIDEQELYDATVFRGEYLRVVTNKYINNIEAVDKTQREYILEKILQQAQKTAKTLWGMPEKQRDQYKKGLLNGTIEPDFEVTSEGEVITD